MAISSLNQHHNANLCAVGNASGLNPSTREQEIAWTSRDEPATLPRVTQLYILTQESPWCTIVKSENGVTMGDVCQTVWKECVLHYT